MMVPYTVNIYLGVSHCTSVILLIASTESIITKVGSTSSTDIMVLVDLDCIKIHVISTEPGIYATAEEIWHKLWLKALYHEMCLLADLSMRLRDRKCNMCLTDIMLLCGAAAPAQPFTVWIAPESTDIYIHLDILFLYSKTIYAVEDFVVIYCDCKIFGCLILSLLEKLKSAGTNIRTSSKSPTHLPHCCNLTDLNTSRIEPSNNPIHWGNANTLQFAAFCTNWAADKAITQATRSIYRVCQAVDLHIYLFQIY